MPELNMIDLSKFQDGPAGNPLPDWDLIATDPRLAVVAARMTHGGHGDWNMRTDVEALHNRDGMRRIARDVKPWAVGFYHFLGTGTPAVQAAHFARTVGPLLPGEFVFLDAEPDEPAKVPMLPVEHIVATLEAIAREFGILPEQVGLYIGAPYTGSRDPRLFRFPLFFPAYISESRYIALAATMGRPVTVWQWGGADVPGIARPVDANRIEDLARFRSMLVKPPAPASPIEPPGPAVTLPTIPTTEDYVMTENPTRYYRALGYANVVATDYASGVPVVPIAAEALPANVSIMVIAPDPDKPGELHPMIARLYSLAGVTVPKPLPAGGPQ